MNDELSTGLRDLLANPLARRALTALVIVVVLVLVAGLVRSWLGRQITDVRSRYHARKIVTYVSYALGTLLIFGIMGGELRGFAISLGVIGAAVAFSLQEVIAGAAGWVAITVGGYLRPGDRVQMGKVRGDVIDVGLFRTTLMEVGEWVRGDLYTGRIVRVSNGTVIREPVFNYSADFPFLWDELTVPVTHTSDWRTAHALLLAAAEAETSGFAEDVKGAWQDMVRRYLIEDARLTPLVTVEANDNWLEFTVRFVTDYRRRRITKDAITQRVLVALAGTDGAVRLASATFEVTGIPPLDLRRGRK